MLPQIVRAHEILIAHMADVLFPFFLLLLRRFLPVLAAAEFGRVSVGRNGGH